MKWIDNITTQTKLIILLGLAITIQICSSVFSIYNVEELFKGTESLYKDRVVPLKKLKIISDCYAVDIVDAAQKARDGIVSRSEAISGISDAQQRIENEWALYSSTYLTYQEKEIMDEVLLRKKEANTYINTLKTILSNPQDTVLSAFVSGELYQNIDPVTISIKKLIDVQIQESEKIYISAEQRLKSMEQLIISFFIITILLLLFFARIIITSITKVLFDLVRTAKEISAGQKNSRALFINREDELGLLSKTFNIMAASITESERLLLEEKNSIEKKVNEAVQTIEEREGYLEESIEKILGSIQQFAQGDVTVELHHHKNDAIGLLFDNYTYAIGNIRQLLLSLEQSAHVVASSATEIAASTEQLSSGVEEQVRQAEQIGNSVEQMMNIIEANSTLAVKATEEGHLARQDARNGGAIVKETIVGIGTIAELTNQSARSIEKLGTSSAEIGDIVSVIEDIADQTNLLALNAAIEAARAGESGRGFAVVADEVRKLAERTQLATKQIASTIKSIQHQTVQVVEQMRRGAEITNKGRSEADKAAQALESIIERIDIVAKIIEQLAIESSKQYEAGENIVSSVKGIISITSQSSVATSEVAKTTEDLSKLTDTLQKHINKFTIHQQGRLQKYN